MSVNRLLAEHCVCPACQGELLWSAEAARCSDCARRYRVLDGIPIFSDAQEGHKHAQAAFFDGRPDEWEIARPHGAPRLYGWLMAEKFRRSIEGLEEALPGSVVATVCGGSGMDAEFLARAGARVIASDISLGAARRVRERARRFGVAITPIVADAEALPFRAGGIEIAYVHDGLHHLQDPLRGLREMARVAGRAVAMTEPAQASATMLAVRLGISEIEEDAGNRVERLDPGAAVRTLRGAGFEVLGAERYAMYYRHEPGAAVRRLSAPGLFAIAKGTFRLANIPLARLGNKLSVRAVKALDPAGTPNDLAAIGGLI